jgi:hypothetical protein
MPCTTASTETTLLTKKEKMTMKIAVIFGTALMTLNPLAHAASLPDGSFKGEGLWKSQKVNGTYEVQSEINGQSISSTYKLPDGSTKKWKVEMRATENGFFDVMLESNLVGTGYCLDHVALCHYEVKTENLTLEETLIAHDDRLYKFGSKTEDGFRVKWQESLGK